MTENQEARLAALAVIDDHIRRGSLANALDATGVVASPPGQFWRVNRVAILFWREYVAQGGLVLDPELWHIENGAVSSVAQAVEYGIINGLDGYKAAAWFLYSSGLAPNVLKADLSHLIDEYTSFQDDVYEFFVAALLLAHGSVQHVIGPD